MLASAARVSSPSPGSGDVPLARRAAFTGAETEVRRDATMAQVKEFETGCKSSQLGRYHW